ncbi:unnamed protein product, partial [Dicrocoelium dendriticum]
MLPKSNSDDVFEPPVIRPDEKSFGVQPPPTPPERFTVGTDLETWKWRMDLYLSAVPPSKRGPYILSHLDPRVQEVLMSSSFSVSSSVEDIWEKLRSLFGGGVSHPGAKHQFWSRSQLVGESLDNYVTDLRCLAVRAFGNLSVTVRESFVLERLVQGVIDEETCEAYAREPPNSVEEAVAIGHKYEAAALVRQYRRSNDNLVSRSQMTSN